MFQIVEQAKTKRNKYVNMRKVWIKCRKLLANRRELYDNNMQEIFQVQTR